MGTQRTVPESYERLDLQQRQANANETTQPYDDDEYEKYRLRRSMRRDQATDIPPTSVIAIESDDTPKKGAAHGMTSSRDGENGELRATDAVQDLDDEGELETQVHVTVEQFPEDRRFKMPQTPAARGVKRKSDGEVEGTALPNTRPPMNPFHTFAGAANDQLLTATQLFNATQAQTSPMPNTVLHDSDRPSPMFNSIAQQRREFSSPSLQPIVDNSPIKQIFPDKLNVVQTQEEDSFDRDMMLENRRSEIRARRRREQADESRDISAALRAGNLHKGPLTVGSPPLQVLVSSESQESTDDSEAETVLQEDVPGGDTLQDTVSTVSDDSDNMLDSENKENEPASVVRVPETEVRKRHPLQKVPWIPSSPIRQEAELVAIQHERTTANNTQFGQSQGNKIIEDSQRSPQHSRQPVFTGSSKYTNRASLILRSQPDVEITSGSSDNLPKPLTSSAFGSNDPRSSINVDELSEPIQGPTMPSTAARLARHTRNVIQSSPSTQPDHNSQQQATQESQPTASPAKPQSQPVSPFQVPPESQELDSDILQEVAKLQEPAQAEKVENAATSEFLTAQTSLATAHPSTAPSPGSPLRRRLSRRLLETKAPSTYDPSKEGSKTNATEQSFVLGSRTEPGTSINDRQLDPWDMPSASLPPARGSKPRRSLKRKSEFGARVSEREAYSSLTIGASPMVSETRSTRQRASSLQSSRTEPESDVAGSGGSDVASAARSKQGLVETEGPADSSGSDGRPILAPMRTFALFIGQWRAFWPGTITSPEQDGKFMVRFDAMTAEKPVLADSLRILDLRVGDIVRTFHVGEKRSFTVIELKNPRKVDVNSIKSLKGVDCFGNSEAVIRPVQKNATDKDNITVSISEVYFEPKHWPEIRETRSMPYLPEKAKDKSGVLTPSFRSRSPDSPFARIKTGSVDIHASKVLAENALFADMVFCTTGKDAEKIRPRAIAHGASVMSDSFEQLFVAIPRRPNEAVKRGETTGLNLREEFKAAKFTALIMTEHVRTLKVMQALALGIPCLSIQWIEHCVAQQRALDWDPYLLPAPKSNYLGELMRSRMLPHAVQPSQTCLNDMLDARPRFFQDASIYIIAHRDAASYYLLLYALGARKVMLVSDKYEAFVAIDDDHSEGPHWDWILCFANSDIPSVDVRGRKGAVSSTELERWIKGLEYKMERDVRVIHREFVAESLILGRLVAS